MEAKEVLAAIGGGEEKACDGKKRQPKEELGRRESERAAGKGG